MGVSEARDPEMELRSFGVVLDQCLMLKPDHEELLVLYDESFFPFFNALLRAVEDRNVLASFHFMPRSYQQMLIRKADLEKQGVRLPASLRESFLQSHAILNVLGGELETKNVRAAVIGLGRGINSRLAHVPGMDRMILEIMSVSDIPSILRSCETMAWALGEARQAELITRDHSGREHVLAMDLGGWENEPIMSPGVLFPGSWGNIPPGETFCCPEPPGVEGSICINGSFHNHVMAEGEDVVLHFHGGRLTRWDCERSPSSSDFFEREKQWAEDNGDPNWCAFAELGIGLNPEIRTLTGNQLFDEKSWGTVHIAIGDNSGFGHTIFSKKHSDLVTRRPTLRLGHRDALVDGVPQVEALDRERAGRLWTGDPVDPQASILLRDDQCHEDDGVLKRLLNRRARIGYVTMAPPEVGAALAKLADELRGDSPRAGDFARIHPEFGGFPTGKLLAMLNHYGILATP